MGRHPFRFKIQLKTPAWWYQPIGWIATCLRPLSWLYRLGNFCHASFALPQCGVLPVICIGGITAGGSGKTPTVIAIADLLTAQGHRVACLTSGYGGRRKGPLWVSAAHHYKDVGDEALELAAHHRTIMSRNRHQGIAMAKQKGATVIVMDDGLQHYALLADIAIAVIDSTEAIGNGLLIPAGPLREPLSQAAKRIDAIIGVGPQAVPAIVPTIFRAATKSGAIDPAPRYIAFCGIATPEKFFRSLAQAGLTIVKEISFADHYAYTKANITRLQTLAARSQALLVTTRKDWVRLPKSAQKVITYLPMHLTFENPTALTAWLTHHLPPLRAK